MAEHEHTPGPWRSDGTELIDFGDGALQHRVIRSPDEQWVALVEDDNNVPLIVAAPELLAALEGMLRCGPRCDPAPGTCCEHVTAAEAALAKARWL